MRNILTRIASDAALTSQGGGALLYDGTILKVIEPLASL